MLLNEKQKDWEKALKIESFPTVFIFNRQGKIEKRYPDDQEKFDYGDIGKVVADLLKK